jgi:hypothetical protein
MMNVFKEFCYSVWNQRKSFICPDLMIKNIEIYIMRYFKWWINIKLVLVDIKIIILLMM